MNANFYGKKSPGFGLRIFAMHLFVGLLVCTCVVAQSLPDLQQSYEKAVAEKATAPYEAAIAALNQKYSAALDRLTANATQAGDLDTALALRDEKKLLLPGGTLPEDTDSTPAALKAARATYRQQAAALRVARAAAAQPLKDHFITLLQGLLTQTAQAGRLDEALIIREKIASLGVISERTPPDARPSKPGPPSAGSSKLITARTSNKTEAEAAQLVIAWALAHDATVTTSLGVVGAGEKLTAAPAGKFSVTEIEFKVPAADFPWSALDGLGELIEFRPMPDTALNAEQTRHFQNLGNLRTLKMIPVTEDGLRALPVFPKLSELELPLSDVDPLPILHLIQERTASIHTIIPIRLPSDEVVDALFSKLSGWPNFSKLHGPAWITAARATHLMAQPKFNEIGLMTGARVEPGCLTNMKKLVSVGFNGTQPPDILQELTTLPKLGRLTLDLEKMSIADIPDFNTCKALTEINLDNVPTPAGEIVAKCSGIAGVKIFKLGKTQVEAATVTALLSFRDLEVLSLNDCKFTPEAFDSLQQLKAIRNLRELNLKNSGIPLADLTALKKALPSRVIRP